MKKLKGNVKDNYNNIMKHLTKDLTYIKDELYNDHLETIFDAVDAIFKRLPYSMKIKTLILKNIEKHYYLIQNHTVIEGLDSIKYEKEGFGPEYYNVHFYQRLVRRFDDRVVELEYSSLSGLLHQILVDEDCIDEIGDIILYMPCWFKDLMRNKVRLDEKESKFFELTN